MPSTIAYDPSLSFASVISNTILDSLAAIANAQQPVEAARDKHKSLMAHKRSLEMTKIELNNLGVGTESIEPELERLNKAILTSTAEYEKVKVVAEPQIAKSREFIGTMQRQMESPVDQQRSGMKTLPISAPSMNMKVKCVDDQITLCEQVLTLPNTDTFRLALFIRIAHPMPLKLLRSLLSPWRPSLG